MQSQEQEEYRKVNQKWIIQENLQHTKTNKTETQHNTISVGHHYTQQNTNSVIKT